MLNLVIFKIEPALHAATAALLAVLIGYEPRAAAVIAATTCLFFLLVGWLDVKRARIREGDSDAGIRESKLFQAELLVLVLPYVLIGLSFLGSVILEKPFTATTASIAAAIGVILGRAAVEQLFLRRPPEPKDEEVGVYIRRQWKE